MLLATHTPDPFSAHNVHQRVADAAMIACSRFNELLRLSFARLSRMRSLAQ